MEDYDHKEMCIDPTGSEPSQTFRGGRPPPAPCSAARLKTKDTLRKRGEGVALVSPRLRSEGSRVNDHGPWVVRRGNAPGELVPFSAPNRLFDYLLRKRVEGDFLCSS